MSVYTGRYTNKLIIIIIIITSQKSTDIFFTKTNNITIPHYPKVLCV